MSDAVLGQEIVTIGKWDLAAGGGIAGVPVQHERTGLHCAQNFRAFGPGRGVTRGLIFQNEDDSLLLGFGGSIAELVVNGIAIGSLIVEAPEIEAAHALRTEGFGHRDGALEDFVLLSQREVGVETLGLAVFRLWRTRPIDLEERAGDVGDLELIFVEQAAGFRDFFFVEADDVLVPHAAQLDPFHAEFFRRHFADVAEVLRDLVIDYGNAEWRGRFSHRTEAGYSGRRRNNHSGDEITARETSRHELLLGQRMARQRRASTIYHHRKVGG